MNFHFYQGNSYSVTSDINTTSTMRRLTSFQNLWTYSISYGSPPKKNFLSDYYEIITSFVMAHNLLLIRKLMKRFKFKKKNDLNQ